MEDLGQYNNNYICKSAPCNFTEVSLEGCGLPAAGGTDQPRCCLLPSVWGTVVVCCSRHAQRNHSHDVSKFYLDMPFKYLSFLYPRTIRSSLIQELLQKLSTPSTKLSLFRLFSITVSDSRAHVHFTVNFSAKGQEFTHKQDNNPCNCNTWVSSSTSGNICPLHLLSPQTQELNLFPRQAGLAF